MTEVPNSEPLPDSKLEGEELANAAKTLRDMFRPFYKNPYVNNRESRFSSGGYDCKVDYDGEDADQERVFVDPHNGEYVEILVAKNPSGVNRISYWGHGRDIVLLQDSVQTVTAISGLFGKIVHTE